MVWLLTLVLVGCQYFPTLDAVAPDRRKEYRKAETLDDLEIPPDLSAESIQDTMAIPGGLPKGTTTLSQYEEQKESRARAKQGGAEGVAGASPASAIALESLPDEQWLVVKGEQADIWPRLSEFWVKQNYVLDLDDVELGVLETNWVEKRTNAGTMLRDKYKVFAEPGAQPGTTALLVSHEGEVQVSSNGTLTWQERVDGVDLEKQAVAELKAYFGGGTTAPETMAVATGAAAQSPHSMGAEPVAAPVPIKLAELVSVGDGKVYLTVREEFSNAWPHTEVALDKAGLTIDDKDRLRGVYYVRYNDTVQAPKAAAEENKGGILSALSFWKDDDQSPAGAKYVLSLTGVGDKTEMVVLDKDGDWDASAAAGHILSLLQEQFNQGALIP
ncbi:MAG: outer membrane protein assembly factor BamC [Gammaproteobacteria bacterium]|nr:outer membrane protein assembly factor BamC [Gammaproteobacteria bacterium]